MQPVRRSGRLRIALWIDKWLGPLICRVLVVFKWLRRDAGPLPLAEDVRKVLVLKLWGMGSLVLASPLLVELRALYPNARIDFVTLQENADILEFLPEVGQTLTVDFRGGIARFFAQTAKAVWGIPSSPIRPRSWL